MKKRVRTDGRYWGVVKRMDDSSAAARKARTLHYRSPLRTSSRKGMRRVILVGGAITGASIVGILAYLVTGWLVPKHPPLLGALDMASVTLVPELGTLSLDPLSREAMVAINGQAIDPNRAASIGFAFDKAHECHAMTLSVEPAGDNSLLRWTPHQPDEPDESCTVEQTVLLRNPMAAANRRLKPTLPATFEIRSDSVILSSLRVSQLEGRIAPAGVAQPLPILLSTSRDGKAFGNRFISLVGEHLSVNQLQVLRADRGSPLMRVSFDGGALESVHLEDHDLGPYIEESWRTTFFRVVTALLSAAGTALGILRWLARKSREP